LKNYRKIKGLVGRHGTGLFRLLERDEIKLGRDDGAFFFRAPDAAQHGSASRGPLYFAWGCFRDFLSRRCRAPLKGRYAGSGTRHRWCLAFTERIDPTPTHHALMAYFEIGRGQLYSIRAPVFPEGKMQVRTRYWILHWVRVVLWPLPVLTFVRAWRATIRSAVPQG
jgi:hypothetical protein